MNESHKINVIADLIEVGELGLSRAYFEADRHRFGVAWLRRLQEAEEDYFIEKRYQGDLLVHWTLKGKRIRQTELEHERLVPIGRACDMEWSEVCR